MLRMAGVCKTGLDLQEHTVFGMDQHGRPALAGARAGRLGEGGVEELARRRRHHAEGMLRDRRVDSSA